MTSEIEDVGACIEKDVGGRALPLLYELLIRPYPMHDREIPAVEIDDSRPEVQGHSEIGSQERIFVMDVDQPEHSVLALIKCLSCVEFCLANRRMLKFEYSRVRCSVAHKHVRAMQFSGR